MMFNGDLMKRATGTERGSLLEAVADNSRLSRRARKSIICIWRAWRASRTAPSWAWRINCLRLARRQAWPQALQDVWWAVLNSNEFILNH